MTADGVDVVVDGRYRLLDAPSPLPWLAGPRGRGRPGGRWPPGPWTPSPSGASPSWWPGWPGWRPASPSGRPTRPGAPTTPLVVVLPAVAVVAGALAVMQRGRVLRAVAVLARGRGGRRGWAVLRLSVLWSAELPTTPAPGRRPGRHRPGPGRRPRRGGGRGPLGRPEPPRRRRRPGRRPPELTAASRIDHRECSRPARGRRWRSRTTWPGGRWGGGGGRGAAAGAGPAGAPALPLRGPGALLAGPRSASSTGPSTTSSWPATGRGRPTSSGPRPSGALRLEGADGAPSLREVAAAGRAPWAGILRDHHDSLCGVVAEIEMHSHRVAQSCRDGLAALAHTGRLTPSPVAVPSRRPEDRGRCGRRDRPGRRREELDPLAVRADPQRRPGLDRPPPHARPPRLPPLTPLAAREVRGHRAASGAAPLRHCTRPWVVRVAGSCSLTGDHADASGASPQQTSFERCAARAKPSSAGRPRRGARASRWPRRWPWRSRPCGGPPARWAPRRRPPRTGPRCRRGAWPGPRSAAGRCGTR